MTRIVGWCNGLKIKVKEIFWMTSYHEGESQKGIKVNRTANRVGYTTIKGSGSQTQYSNAHNNGIC